MIIVYAQLFQDIAPMDSVPAIDYDYTRWPLFIATTIYTFEVTVNSDDFDEDYVGGCYGCDEGLQFIQR